MRWKKNRCGARVVSRPVRDPIDRENESIKIIRARFPIDADASPFASARTGARARVWMSARDIAWEIRFPPTEAKWNRSIDRIRSRLPERATYLTMDRVENWVAIFNESVRYDVCRYAVAHVVVERVERVAAPDASIHPSAPILRFHLNTITYPLHTCSVIISKPKIPYIII